MYEEINHEEEKNKRNKCQTLCGMIAIFILLLI